MSKVAVCVASYNSAKYLLELLESLKQQTYQNFRIYISYDGSTDNTEYILRQYKGIIVCDYKNIKGCGRILRF